MSVPILLIHGAWHGAWCWARLIAELEARSRRAIAIDLPGAGDDVLPPEAMTLDLWTARIAETLAGIGDKTILVGHSMGGIAITAAAEAVPERIERLVYLCAFLPQDGQSLADIAGTFDSERSLLRQAVSPDGKTVMPTPDSTIAGLYADCPPEAAQAAMARLRPLGLAPVGTKVHVTPDRFGRIPRVYIECTEDRAIPIEAQRAMVAASPCERVVTMRTSHSPFLSAPAELADILAYL
ncbi:MAG TPA: alpha/beta fold hydrolase [Stellaceae bacterium]|nr:alpha/beta fold hydrolase [Stellaceae bacterium]